ncbi:hypothetical protein C0431_03010 [bacterium]|nr:hypothetical protein [bacterium]
MQKQLPTRPDLDHLKREAKALALPHSEALHSVALSYGFASWPKLKARVEEINMSRLAPEAWLKKADSFKVIARHPNRDHNWWVALANGDADVVVRLLSSDSNLAQIPGGPLERYPLHYVSCLWVNSKDAAGCARVLIEHGADPNVTYVHPDYPNDPLPVLWGAVGIKHDVELTRVLLEAGADPNDNESLYHCVEHDEPEILQLLIDHGVDVNRFNGLARALDFDRIVQVEMLLKAGADPNLNLGSETMIHHAIRRGRGLQFIQLLVEMGADLSSMSSDRLNVVDHAAYRGDWESFEFLQGRTSVSGSEEATYVAQVRGGRPATVPSPGQLSSKALSTLGLAVFNGQRELVFRMLAAGWPVDAQHDGSTPLHCACFIGDEVMVNHLIKLGSPLDSVDHRYGATPLGWALHGEVHNHAPRGDYAQCVRLMVEAGCVRPNSDWTMSDDMRDVLLELDYLE